MHDAASSSFLCVHPQPCVSGGSQDSVEKCALYFPSSPLEAPIGGTNVTYEKYFLIR